MKYAIPALLLYFLISGFSIPERVSLYESRFIRQCNPMNMDDEAQAMGRNGYQIVGAVNYKNDCPMIIFQREKYDGN